MDNEDFIKIILNKGKKYYIKDSGSENVSIYSSDRKKLSIKDVLKIGFQSFKEMENYLIKASSQKLDKHTEDTFYKLLQQNLLVEGKYTPTHQMCLKLVKGVNYKTTAVGDFSKELEHLKKIKKEHLLSFKYETFNYPVKIPKLQALIKDKGVGSIEKSTLKVIPLYIKVVTSYL